MNSKEFEAASRSVRARCPSSGEIYGPRAFLPLAGGELVVFGAAIALAVALSRSPTPVPTNPVAPDPLVELLGFAAPAALSAARLLGDPLPDMFFLTVVAVGIGAYIAGVVRMRRTGHPWPVSRTLSLGGRAAGPRGDMVARATAIPARGGDDVAVLAGAYVAW